MYPKCPRFFLAILNTMKPIFLYFTTNICYNSAKPYMSNQRGHLIDKKNLGKVKWVKLWSINPLLAITHNTFFYSIIFSTAITNHAFSRIEVYVNASIERDIAYYCRCIQRVKGLQYSAIFDDFNHNETHFLDFYHR